MKRVLYSMIFTALSFLAILAATILNNHSVLSLSIYGLVLGLTLTLAFISIENKKSKTKSKL